MKRNIFTLGLITFIGLLFPQSIRAQDVTQEWTNEVLVSMDKLDLPLDKNNRDVTIISSEQIALMPARSIGDVLASISGVDVRQRGVNGAQADISIDGGTFDQITILINGHKMSDPQTGHNMMNLPISMMTIDRIEILKGPAASRYGVNGLSGVINIVTRQSQEKELFVSAQLGSNFQNDSATNTMYQNYGIQVVESRKINKWQHLVSLAYDQSNGYQYNSSYSHLKALMTAQYEVNDHINFKLMAGYVNNEFDAKDYYAYPRDAQSTERVETFIAGVKMPIYLENKRIITPYVTYRYAYDDYIFVKNNPSLFRNQHHTHTIDGGVDYAFNNILGKNSVGINTRYESINSTNLGDRLRNNFGIFYENYNKWNVVDMRIGAYLNYNSVFRWNLYPQLEMGFAINPNNRIYTNVGLGQRLPTFTDLYYSSPTNMGNDQLTPEHAVTAEIGYKGQIEGLQLSGAVFHRWGYDMIDWIRKDTTEAWQVFNFAKIHTLGFKTQAHHTWNWNNHQSFTVKTQYTFLKPTIAHDSDPEKSQYMSQYTINALKHHWVNTMTYKHHSYFMTLTHRFLDRIVGENTIHPDFKPYYHVFDMKLGFNKDKFTMHISAQNLTSETYIEAGMVTMPQLWISLGAYYKIY